MSNFFQFFDIFIPSFTIFFDLFWRYTGVISKNTQNKSEKSELFFPILVGKNGKEQSRSRMNLYIYARDLGKKREKKAIFQACFFEEKSIYAPKKSDRELLGHTLMLQSS